VSKKVYKLPKLTVFGNIQEQTESISDVMSLQNSFLPLDFKAGFGLFASFAGL